VDTLTSGLAREVAEEGIRVNAVRGGFIYSDIHVSGASRIVWIASNNSLPDET